jgi:hypothetical protein
MIIKSNFTKLSHKPNKIGHTPNGTFGTLLDLNWNISLDKFALKRTIELTNAPI